MSKQTRPSLHVGLFLPFLIFTTLQLAKAQTGNCQPPGISAGWSQVFGGASVKGNAVATNSNGAIFVTGEFSGINIDFNPGSGVDVHSSNGGLDIFVTKFNPDGSYVWTKTMGGPANDSGLGITFDTSGAMFIAGYSNTAMDFNPDAGVDWSADKGVFVLKFNLDESYSWKQVVVQAPGQSGITVAVNSTGAVFLAASFYGSIFFDSASGSIEKTSNGSLDIFVVKFDSNGSFMWVQTFGGFDDEFCSHLAVDTNGAVLIVGSFASSEVDFNPSEGVDIHVNQTENPVFTFDVFVTKLNADGSYAWTNTVGGPSADYGYGITIDSTGAVFISGGFSGEFDFDPTESVDIHFSLGFFDAFITKFTSNGAYEWTKSFGGGENTFASGLAVDSGDAVSITGSFKGTNVDFNPDEGIDLHSASQKNLYLTKLYSDGSYAWTKTFGSNLVSSGYGITISSNDTIFVVGSLNFDAITPMTLLAQYIQDNVTFFLDCNGNGQLDSCDIASGTSFDLNQNGIPDECESNLNPPVEGDCNSNGIPDDEDIANGTSLDCNNNGFPDECEPLNLYYGWTHAIEDYNQAPADVAVDASGAVFSMGRFHGINIDFDPGQGIDLHSTSGTQDFDIFVTKFNGDGSYAWTQTFANPPGTSDKASRICVDSKGAVLIIGSFYNTMDFDPSEGVDIHASQGFSDVFITKLNADGSYAWTKTFGGLSAESGVAVAVDKNDAVLLTGSFGGSVDFNPDERSDFHTSQGSIDVFITKLSTDGSYVWTKTFGGSSSDIPMGIAIDSNSNVFVTGTFFNTVDFNPTGGGDVHVSYGFVDFFITKIQGNGNYAWTQTFGGPSSDYSSSIAVDSYGSVVTVGHFHGTVDFDPTIGLDIKTSVSILDDIFIMKLYADGSYAWTKTIGGGSYDSPSDVAVDSNSSIFVVGGFESLVVDFDPSDEIDNHFSQGHNDIFLTKLNSDGSYGWTVSYGGKGYDALLNIALDTNGAIFVGGYSISAVMDFDPTAHMDLYRSDLGSGFVTKFIQPDPQSFADCNGNRSFDSCDIASGFSLDLNTDGIPDECQSFCNVDLDHNGIVNGADLGIFLAAWGTTSSNVDFNGDGNVDGADLGELLAHWGVCF